MPNQEQEWHEDKKYYDSYEFNGVDVSIPDVPEIVAEAERRGRVGAVKALEGIKTREPALFEQPTLVRTSEDRLADNNYVRCVAHNEAIQEAIETIKQL